MPALDLRYLALWSYLDGFLLFVNSMEHYKAIIGIRVRMKKRAKDSISRLWIGCLS